VAVDGDIWNQRRIIAVRLRQVTRRSVDKGKYPRRPTAFSLSVPTDETTYPGPGLVRVTEIRGIVSEGTVGAFQVTMKVAFRVEDG
jgi:hypothetical protein